MADEGVSVAMAADEMAEDESGPAEHLDAEEALASKPTPRDAAAVIGLWAVDESDTSDDTVDDDVDRDVAAMAGTVAAP